MPYEEIYTCFYKRSNYPVPPTMHACLDNTFMRLSMGARLHGIMSTVKIFADFLTTWVKPEVNRSACDLFYYEH